MPSVSSSKLIRERTLIFCKKIKDWEDLKKDSSLFSQIKEYLQEEYDLIPEKERIGKGAIYISKYISKQMVDYLKNTIKLKSDYFVQLSELLFEYGENKKDYKLNHFALYIFAEFIFQFPECFEKTTHLLENWANHEEWQFRESTGEIILSALEKNKEKTLDYLEELATNDNEKLRRLVSESLRPRADIKWLRDPNKNDRILNILTILRKDPSIYVRKSVGNNLKDLTKYIPEKILDLMQEWIKSSNIKVYGELSSEEGLNKDQKLLIWTMKQALRWLKDRNPEFHPKLENLLGKNYVLYFNEKKNRLAKKK